MPDISMCEGTGCPLKETCYRFIAEPSEYRQSYMTTPLKKDNTCDYYWNTRPIDNFINFK